MFISFSLIIPEIEIVDEFLPYLSSKTYLFWFISAPFSCMINILFTQSFIII
jgi:hypothetical protein